MATLFSYFLTILALLVLIPSAVLCLEVVAAILRPHRPDRQGLDICQRIAVLVPAHNESTALLPTLSDIKKQLRANDRLLVVADNCTDDTAALASSAGAEIVRRQDIVRIGKGYALDCGLQRLRSDPPEIVIVIDADCRLADGALDQLVKSCVKNRRPTQAAYLMVAPAKSQINHQVAEFAWLVKNLLRPLGLAAVFSRPCPLFGTGMAFPWAAISSVDLANGSLVEDIKLGLDLTEAGHPPIFCPTAHVSSQFASSTVGAKGQRERWERGHIGMILAMVPQLLLKALRRRDWNLLALTIDLAVPPLSLLALLVCTLFVATLLWALFGFSLIPLTTSTLSLTFFLVAVLLAWLRCGRDVLPARAISSIVPYVFSKFGLYNQILSGRLSAQWTRTDRTEN